MNKIQVAVIWASLSILLVAGYLTYKEVSLRDFQISQDSSLVKKWQSQNNNGADETQTKIEELVWRHEEERDKAIQTFVILAFGLLSGAGLLWYLFKGKK